MGYNIMAHSEKCPVCDGTGKYKKDWSDEEMSCHGCNGRGWITIKHEPIPYVPQPYYPINPQPWPQPDYWYPYSPGYPYYEPTWTTDTPPPSRWGTVTINPCSTEVSGTTYQLPEDAQIFHT